MSKLAYRALSAGFGLSAVTALAAVALAQGPIEQRQKIMESNNDALKPLIAMAKKEAPFDAAVVNSTAEQVAQGLAKAKDLFPEGSHTGEKETSAKPEIWQNKDAFNQIFDRTIGAAQRLATVEQEADFLPALVELGNACTACHDRFRQPEE